MHCYSFFKSFYSVFSYLQFNWHDIGDFQKIVPGIPAQLLEFDKRFEQYGDDFTFYDYNQPDDLPSSLKHSFPIVVADPPYLVYVIFLVNSFMR